MSDASGGARTRPRDSMILAVILIGVGIVGLVSRVAELQPSTGGLVVLVIGLGLLAVFAFTRQYGFLIPGGIMTGLGAGIAVSESVTLTDEQAGGVVVLGLGVGFVAIWLVGAIVRVVGQHAWPLVPGGILSAIGVALLMGGQAVDVLDYWGVAIIALGLVVLFRAWLQVRAHQ